MTNELVLYKQLDNLEKTLQDAEAKADRKREVLEALDFTHKFVLDAISLLSKQSNLYKVKKDFPLVVKYTSNFFETIRKYIEEN